MNVVVSSVQVLVSSVHCAVLVRTEGVQEEGRGYPLMVGRYSKCWNSLSRLLIIITLVTEMQKRA